MAVLLTPLLWVPVTLLLYAGFAVIVFGWLLPPLAALCGWCCSGLLTVVTACVGFAHGLPAGQGAKQEDLLTLRVVRFHLPGDGLEFLDHALRVQPMNLDRSR